MLTEENKKILSASKKQKRKDNMVAIIAVIVLVAIGIGIGVSLRLVTVEDTPNANPPATEQPIQEHSTKPSRFNR